MRVYVDEIMLGNQFLRTVKMGKICFVNEIAYIIRYKYKKHKNTFMNIIMSNNTLVKRLIKQVPTDIGE